MRTDAFTEYSRRLPDTGQEGRYRWGPYRAGELVDALGIWEVQTPDDTGGVLRVVFLGEQRKEYLGGFLTVMSE